MKQETVNEEQQGVSPNLLLWNPRLFSETMNHRVIKDQVRHFGLTSSSAAAAGAATAAITPVSTRSIPRTKEGPAASICSGLLPVPTSSSPSLDGSQKRTAERLSRNDRWRSHPPPPHHPDDSHHHHDCPLSPTRRTRQATATATAKDAPPIFRGRSSSPIPVPVSVDAAHGRRIALSTKQQEPTTNMTDTPPKVSHTKKKTRPSQPRASLGNSKAAAKETTSTSKTTRLMMMTTMMIVQDSDKEWDSSNETLRGTRTPKKPKKTKKKNKKSSRNRSPDPSSGGLQETTRTPRTVCRTPTETSKRKSLPTTSSRPRRRGSTGPLVDLWETRSTQDVTPTASVPVSLVATTSGHERDCRRFSVVDALDHTPTTLRQEPAQGSPEQHDGVGWMESWQGSGVERGDGESPLRHKKTSVTGDVVPPSSKSPLVSPPSKGRHRRTAPRRGSTGTLAVRWEEVLLPSLYRPKSPTTMTAVTKDDGTNNIIDGTTSQSDHCRSPSRRRRGSSSLGTLVDLWENQLSPSMRSGSRRSVNVESLQPKKKEQEEEEQQLQVPPQPRPPRIDPPPLPGKRRNSTGGISYSTRRKDRRRNHRHVASSDQRQEDIPLGSV